jgi:hypothetical protein
MLARLLVMVAVCSLLCLAGNTARAQAVTLKYKLEKGTAYRYADTLKMNTTQEMMGQEMKVENTITAVTRIAVEDLKSNGNTALFVSTDTMRIHVKNPRMDTTMVPAEMLHKRTRVTATPFGEVLSREVVDSISGGSMMRGAGAMASREMLRFPVFSGKPVKQGDKWTYTKIDTQDAAAGKTITNTTYDYTMAGTDKMLGREVVKVTYTAKMTINSKGSMMGMDVFTEGGGKGSGTLYFDEKAGLLVVEDTKMEMEMTAAVKGQQNMTIPISQSGTVKHVLLPN